MTEDKFGPAPGGKEILREQKEKPKPPKRLGHGLSDKRPHFKSFKSPGVK